MRLGARTCPPGISSPTRTGSARSCKNLLSNAFKFTQQGQVELRIRRETPQIPGAEAGLAFSVSDTGIGISDDSLKTIFEAFQQGDGTTSRRYGGTGLGLFRCE